MAVAEVFLACGSAFIGGGIGSALTMAVWLRRHQPAAAVDDSWDGVGDAEFDDDEVWESAVSWANRNGRPHAATLAVGYMRDTAEYLIHQRRDR